VFGEKVTSQKVSIETITSYFGPSTNESMMLYHQSFIQDNKIKVDPSSLQKTNDVLTNKLMQITVTHVSPYNENSDVPSSFSFLFYSGI
jgi:Icc-related predicted phosphoesterase